MEKSKNSFILFFTDKDFRKSKIQYLKFRISLLPGIRQILSWWFAFQYAMKTKDLSPWDQHVAKMNLERTSRKTIFVCALIRLYGQISAQDEYRNPEDFLTTKKEVLECEFWKDVPELSDFKKWVESLSPEERNAEPVMDVLKKYNKPE